MKFGLESGLMPELDLYRRMMMAVDREVRGSDVAQLLDSLGELSF